jgi:hypothetical protein
MRLDDLGRYEEAKIASTTKHAQLNLITNQAWTTGGMR